MTKPLHEQLAKAVAHTGLNQRAIADFIGVTQPQLNHWLTGYRTVPIQRAEQIAKACGCALSVRVIKSKA